MLLGKPRISLVWARLEQESAMHQNKTTNTNPGFRVVFFFDTAEAKDFGGRATESGRRKMGYKNPRFFSILKTGWVGGDGKKNLCT